MVFQPNKDFKQQRPAMTARNDPAAEKPVDHIKESQEERARKPYQFLMVNVLREYLALEMAVRTPFPYDVERVYDDFGTPPPLP